MAAEKGVVLFEGGGGGGVESMGAIREFTARGVVSKKWVTVNSARKERIQSNLRAPRVRFSCIWWCEGDAASEGWRSYPCVLCSSPSRASHSLWLLVSILLFTKRRTGGAHTLVPSYPGYRNCSPTSLLTVTSNHRFLKTRQQKA